MIGIIVNFFEEHKTIKKVIGSALTAGSIAFLTVIVDAEALLISSLPEYAMLLVVLFSLVNGALNYLKHNNPLKK